MHPTCRRPLTLCFAALACVAFQFALPTAGEESATPDRNADAGMGVACARHLLARTGFGGTAPEIERFALLAPDAAARTLVAGMQSEAQAAPPAWANEPLDEVPGRDMSEEDRAAARRLRREQGEELKAWWLGEMLSTSSPLTERMTLFWHNHFTSSLEKVKSPRFLYGQNLLLRRHAKGNFATLLHAIARDPAMVNYLDSQSNEKGNPNENFARELLELFTLGEGNYTELDVKEAARAFTGWKVSRRTGAFVFARRRHDDGIKTFLGRTGALDGDQIIDILLEQPQTAKLITTKLWREFVSSDPDAGEVARLAGILRSSKYELAPLLEAMLSSPHLFAESNRGGLIKSPIDLIVGTLRQIPGTVRDPRDLNRTARAMGQDLFNPPNVKGWPGGAAWITSSTLLLREGFLHRTLMGVDAGIGRRRRPERMADSESVREWFDQLGPSVEARVSRVHALLLPLPPVDLTPDGEDSLVLLREILLDPVYQLK